MLKRYDKCIGLSLPAFGKYKIEIWFAPRGYTIKPHTHPNQDIKLVFLFGHDIKFHRQKKGEYLGQSFFAQLKHLGKVFKINAGDIHWFEVSNWPLIFMNIEKWKIKPTSAADDFVLTK